MRKVIDTNVMSVANKNAPQVSNDPECMLACTHLLETIRKTGKVILDDSWHVLSEYGRNLNSQGQPGFGDYFFKWLLNHKENPSYCEMFTIHPFDKEGNFEEFPQDQALANFDFADRKFVALSIVSTAEVSTAVDPGWWKYRSALSRNGVTVEFLCQHFVENYQR